MPKPMRWSSLVIALGLAMSLPLGSLAQSDAGDESESVPLPELEDLAWHRSIDLSGPEIQDTLSQGEVEDWATLLDGANATFDQLEYTYQAAFDPTTLPDMGGLATVRVAGVETSLLHELVVEDIVGQVVGLGHDAPSTEPSTIGQKDVTVIDLPEAMGFADAIVYARDDVAYIFLMEQDLAAGALEQLP